MTGRKRLRVLGLVVVVATAGLVGLVGGVASGGGGPAGQVLILDTALDAGASYNEEDSAISLGFTVDVVDAATWAGMSTADFAAYRAIVFGDPDCQENGGAALGAALDSLATWTPAITGNVVVHTFDPIAHDSDPGSVELMDKGIAWATGVSGQTGMYLSTSCYNGPSVDNLLNALVSGWSFVSEEAASSVAWGDDIHVVGSNPSLDGLTDEELSGWGDSTHGFFSTWPGSFGVFAIVSEEVVSGGAPISGQAEDDPTDPPLCQCVPDDFTAGDQTVGSPVILVRGAVAEPV